MKIFKNLFITLLGLAALSMIVACPESNTNMLTPGGGGGNSTNTNGGNGGGGNVEGVTNGAGWIFSDDASLLASAGQVLLAEGSPGQTAGPSENRLTLTETMSSGRSDGANSTSGFWTYSVTLNNTTWAAQIWFFSPDSTYKVPAAQRSTTFLRFYVRAAVDGPTSIKAKLETSAMGFDDNTESAEIKKTFTADGTWQVINIPISEFVLFDATRGANYDLNNGIFNVVILLGDSFGDFNNPEDGIGAQSIDVDEIQFVTNN